MFKQINDVYRNTLCEKDRLWTKVMGRPLASVIVYFIKGTRITPNQVTILSYLVAILSGCIFIFCRTYTGLIMATLIYHLSFVLDCVDGQLARVKNIQTQLGILLDSFFDRAKAYVVVGCISSRLFLIHQDAVYLILGMLAIVLITTSIELGQKNEANKNS